MAAVKHDAELVQRLVSFWRSRLRVRTYTARGSRGRSIREKGEANHVAKSHVQHLETSNCRALS